MFIAILWFLSTAELSIAKSDTVGRLFILKKRRIVFRIIDPRAD
jgi:hypothetical protein